MNVTELTIPGSYKITNRIFADDRGGFLEYFKAETLSAATGRVFDLAQANCSYSKKGVVRGIHAAQVPPSQAKYVTCVKGAIVDVIVDIRVGSPTFGHHELVPLDDQERNAVFLSEGLGHGFMALTDDAVVTYLCSTGYNPEREFGIHPMDSELNIAWPQQDLDGKSLTPLLSAKDQAAPTFPQAQTDGLLPTWAQCQDFYATCER